MPQSLAKIYIHLIFSKKNRERCLPDEIRLKLHAYMGGILSGLGCSPIAFSVSQSAVEEVRQYIRNQRTHHEQLSFQDIVRF